MIHKVLADGVVTVQSESEFELRADAIDARNKNGLLVFSNCESEEPAKPADLAEDFRTMCCCKELRQCALDLVTKIDVDTGARVGFLFHLRGQIMGKRTVEPRLKCG